MWELKATDPFTEVKRRWRIGFRTHRCPAKRGWWRSAYRITSPIAATTAKVSSCPTKTGATTRIGFAYNSSLAAWLWSSARAHATGRDDSGLIDWLILEQFGGCADWPARLAKGQVEAAEERLRTATRSGKPFGNESFQNKLEADLGMPAGWSRVSPH